MIKILSFQPFSLYSNGGGNRILRRLYQGKEAQVISLAVEGVKATQKKGDIEEVIVTAFPLTRWWMKWRLRNAAIWLREKGLKSLTKRKIQIAAAKLEYEVLHVVNHGPYSTALCDKRFIDNKKLWVSFHDHFSTVHTPMEDAEKLWKMADRRLVISNELGFEYQRLFGAQSFELITDGVAADEMMPPLKSAGQPVIVYFAGLLHLAYIPLFQVLANAMDLLSEQGFQFELILRGTQRIGFLDYRSFSTVYKPVSLNNVELKAELDSAVILYLPIKFKPANFYLYSLSTKMIGYLGAPGAILYHGPGDSAASHLLTKSSAASCCNSLNLDELVVGLRSAIDDCARLSENATILAAKEFNLITMQSRFWEE